MFSIGGCTFRLLLTRARWKRLEHIIFLAPKHATTQTDATRAFIRKGLEQTKSDVMFALLSRMKKHETDCGDRAYLRSENQECLQSFISPLKNFTHTFLGQNNLHLLWHYRQIAKKIRLNPSFTVFHTLHKIVTSGKRLKRHSDEPDVRNRRRKHQPGVFERAPRHCYRWGSSHVVTTWPRGPCCSVCSKRVCDGTGLGASKASSRQETTEDTFTASAVPWKAVR